MVRTIVIVYLCIAFIWSMISIYKHRVTYPRPLNNWLNCTMTGIINFLVCPVSMYVAFKKKKIHIGFNKKNI